jgi:hypothetical protein
MIDIIQNGVTSGGVAPTVYQPIDAGNIYRQYMEQADQARKESLNKNYDLVKDVDLSKVDPRDRPAVEKQYEDWRNMALSVPVSNKRGDYNRWRASVLQGQSDLKNKISDIMGRRRELVDGVARRRDMLDHDGLNTANQWIDAPVVDDKGNFATYDYNTLGLKPEHVYDVDGLIQKQVGTNITKSQQLAQHHRGKDGKTVSIDADVLNTNGLTKSLQDQLNYNPEFKYALDKEYSKFKSVNPNSQVTFDQYFNDRIKHHYPAMSQRDSYLYKDVPAGDGLYAFNYNVKDPNNYVQRVNINSVDAAAKKKEAVLNLHNNVLGSIARYFASGSPDDAQAGSQLTSQVLRGQKFGDKGTLDGIHLGSDGSGKKYLEFYTKTDDYTIPKKSKIYSDDPNWDRKIHDMFNGRFTRTPQDMIGEDVFNNWRGVKKGIESNITPVAPTKPKNSLLNLGSKLKKGLTGLKNLGR